jgi:hypothetical protein
VVSAINASTGPLSVRNPDFIKFTDDGAGSQGLFTYSFPSNKVTELYIQCQLPHTYKEGSQVNFHVHFQTPTFELATSITLGIEYTWYNVGDTIPNTTITELSQLCPAANTHSIFSFGFLVGNADKRISSIISMRVYRVSGLAGNYSGGVRVISMDFHVQNDTTSGSLSQFSKD